MKNGSARMLLRANARWTEKHAQPGEFIEWLKFANARLFDNSVDYLKWEVSRVIKEVMRTNRYEVVIRNTNYLLKKHIIKSSKP